jgi:hypothetical protein
MARARPKFTEKQCKQFEDAANPHQWLLTADRLHTQAVEIHNRRHRGTLTQIGADGVPVASWDGCEQGHLSALRLRARERNQGLPDLRTPALGVMVISTMKSAATGSQH